jgi:hypothetical protein
MSTGNSLKIWPVICERETLQKEADTYYFYVSDGGQEQALFQSRHIEYLVYKRMEMVL